MNRFVESRPAPIRLRRAQILELANAVEPYFDNRILMEKLNGPFVYKLKAREYRRAQARERQAMAAIPQSWHLRTLHPARRRSVRLSSHLEHRDFTESTKLGLR